MSEYEFEVRDCGYDTECWVWLKATNEKGYGRTSHEGKTRRAHRVYYELIRDIRLRPEEQLDHLCENESCVNPDHMEIVNNLENQKRRASMTKGNAERIIALKGQLSQEKLAEMFGISRRYVRDIQAGRIAEWQ